MSQRLARLALCFYTVLAALILWLEAVVLLCCARRARLLVHFWTRRCCDIVLSRV